VLLGIDVLSVKIRKVLKKSVFIGMLTALCEVKPLIIKDLNSVLSLQTVPSVLDQRSFSGKTHRKLPSRQFPSAICQLRPDYVRKMKSFQA
jgi:hypothetical protein